MARRYKPVGWRNEPHRHSLAARGISTKKATFFANKNREFYANKKKKEKFERCVKDVAKDHPDGKDAAYGICGASLGYVVTDGKISKVDESKRNFAEKTTLQRENDIEAYFDNETGHPAIDRPVVEDEVIESRMSPDDFMRQAYEQYRNRANDLGERVLDYQEFLDANINSFKKEQIYAELEDGYLMKTPYLEFEDGSPFAYEGLNRAAVAKELGIEEIPVVLVDDAEANDARL